MTAKIQQFGLHTEAQLRGASEFCPETGRQFFAHVEHPRLGLVATYGGPYDTYSVPKRVGQAGADDEWQVEHYDQDNRSWTTEVHEPDDK